jgi:hypothetical protein
MPIILVFSQMAAEKEILERLLPVYSVDKLDF